ACLFASDKLGAESVYARKLEIIENNLYGVDKDVFAVNIARLRLWLSLSVDGDKPQPLPNLKYKLEQGDSLITPVMVSQLSLRAGSVQEFQRLKSEYLTAHGKEKKAGLEKKIEDIKEQIATFTPGVYKAGDFDWMVDFAEIIADGGFDIQVANPPYVRMELFKEIKSTLKKNFPEAHSDRSDLYCYFYARSLQLLKPEGMLAFISSNKWFKAGYGAKLREYIAKACQIHSITDFGDLRIFKEASVSTAIFIGQRIAKSNSNVIFTQVKSLNLQNLNVKDVITQDGSVLPHNAIIGENWLLTDNITAKRINQMESASIPLSKYVNGEIYYGVKTGFNQAFSIDENIRVKLISENPASEEIIKPLLEGKDVDKWNIKYKDRYLLYMYYGIDIKKLDAVISYLKPYRQQLEKRATNQEWYELQQPQMKYSTAFDKPKIIYPDICQTSRFAFDDKGAFTRDTTFVIPKNDMYLLGVLNSTHV
ncbi:Eco57I restriction-modification methylase domain-containing protein, partial [Chamaesiphon sp. OTE_8_metabat_110]|uniref:Eco57I restriction-modification methylase domain-containing protein n=1 Tax=Chamaesiphon sp. OTE_8_metabat_110 TaxID=2964696 RepID=UPI00286A1F13